VASDLAVAAGFGEAEDHAATVDAALIWPGWLPMVLIGLPRAHGIWRILVMGLSRQRGLAEDVLDFRLNAPAMIFGQVLRFICRKMNSHAEHHISPMVPYRALPRLHGAAWHDCPPRERLWQAGRLIIPTVLRQLKDPGHFIRKDLTPGSGRPVKPRLPPNRAAMTWTEALPLDAIDPGDVIRRDHAGATCALYHTEDDALLARDGLCTHERVPLADGRVMGLLIECPKQNGRFDIRDGSARRAPVCVALRTCPARVEGGMIWVAPPGLGPVLRWRGVHLAGSRR
jgi:MocE subfamily Rieske [2Fe-2S] domain protein